MHTSAACRNRESRSPGVPVPPSPASSPAFSRSSSAVTCSSMLVPAAAAWAACALYQSISRSVSSVEMNAPCTRSSALLPGGRNSMSPFKHGLGAVLVEDGPAVHLGRDPKRDATGKIRLDEAGDDVHGRTLGREHEVNPDGPGLLRQGRE